ncbi:Asp23/Gls24 family envelope stress response protein [Amycolatopsis sp. WQ 127309]|uniref:Asp23/Gls24 family envelope stress response protein n=1 Tax=Amycolatopsis sp. WQ 127309 TaxID=2932773 RepID=UPI001FF6706A|nr:Asp23/Gls24 family envelope stress response protein [Amycolatopsis sp. WQ 127309]UOZ04889.1 Asp23/Gls24 family envelope stress response protein [Amycolatopsis sp. WQ 127309]
MTTTVPRATPRTDGLEERGRLTISDTTVERIAAHAVTEVEGVGGAASRVLGVAVGGENPGTTAKVTAKVSGGTAALDVRLSVAYPASVGETTGNARRHLMRRVGEFTGLSVSRVDITVTALRSATTETRRVR